VNLLHIILLQTKKKENIINLKLFILFIITNIKTHKITINNNFCSLSIYKLIRFSTKWWSHTTLFIKLLLITTLVLSSIYRLKRFSIKLSSHMAFCIYDPWKNNHTNKINVDISISKFEKNLNKWSCLETKTHDLVCVTMKTYG